MAIGLICAGASKLIVNLKHRYTIHLGKFDRVHREYQTAVLAAQLSVLSGTKGWCQVMHIITKLRESKEAYLEYKSKLFLSFVRYERE